MSTKRVCIVTGSTRGSGSAFILVFADHGYTAVGLDVFPQRQQVADQVNGWGESLFLSFDVSMKRSMR